MDSQSINPLPVVASGPQGKQAAPQPAAQASAAVAAQSAVAAKSERQPVESRARDPRTLQFQVDGSTKEIVATIVDEHDKTVVVQIPNEEVLRIAKAIDRMKGFLLEGKA